MRTRCSWVALTAVALAMSAGAVNPQNKASRISKTEYEMLRQKALERRRVMLWDDDGCDMMFYPKSKSVSAENFDSVFLELTERTRLDTITYSPVMGFGYFLTSRAGYMNDLARPEPDSPCRNAIRDFVDKTSKDAIDLATDFARRTGREMVLSLRFNDKHDSTDAVASWDKPNKLFAPFKFENPDCLTGLKPGAVPTYGSWTPVDFSKPKVRAFCLEFMREFFENYDLDGVMYDFFRHPQLFPSVAWGGKASQEELDIMTDLMKELRDLAEEVGRKRGRPFILSIRVPDSVGYCRDIGIDLERWLTERVVDYVVAGGYFQLRPWKDTADLVHRYGMKCYASLDDARTGTKRLISGRGKDPDMLGRAASAIVQGMDGVFYYNYEYGKHEPKRRLMSVDPRDTDGFDKDYFCDSSLNDWSVRYFLPGGPRHRTLGGISPERPIAMEANSVFEFNMAMADDWSVWRARGREPKITIMLLTAEDATPALSVNGVKVEMAQSSSTPGLLLGSVPYDAMRKGDNHFRISSAKHVRLYDFCVRVSGKDAEKFTDPEKFGFASAADGATNAEALRKALAGGGKVVKTTWPGEFAIDGTIRLESGTRLEFAPGTVLVRCNQSVPLFACSSGTKDIVLRNIELRVKSADMSAAAVSHFVFDGASGISLENIVVEDCGLAPFVVEARDFDGFRLEKFAFRGGKGGIRLARGRDFTIRNGRCRTGSHAIVADAADVFGGNGARSGAIAGGLVEDVVCEVGSKLNFAYLVAGADAGPGQPRADVRDVAFRNVTLTDNNMIFCDWSFARREAAKLPDLDRKDYPLVSISLNHVRKTHPGPIVCGLSSADVEMEDVLSERGPALAMGGGRMARQDTARYYPTTRQVWVRRCGFHNDGRPVDFVFGDVKSGALASIKFEDCSGTPFVTGYTEDIRTEGRCSMVRPTH